MINNHNQLKLMIIKMMLIKIQIINKMKIKLQIYKEDKYQVHKCKNYNKIYKKLKHN